MLILFAAMAVLMPVLVHRTVWWLTGLRNTALIAGLVTVASMSPFMSMRHMMTEQPYQFLLVLMVALTAYHFRRGRPGTVYAVGLVGWALYLVRPSGMLMIGFALLAAGFNRPRRWWHPALTLLLVLTLNAGWSLYRTYRYQPTLVNGPNWKYHFGESLFYQFYLADDWGDAGGAGASPVAAEHGPASAQLFADLRHALHDMPGNWETLGPEAFISDYAGRPDDLLAAMWREPSLPHFGLMVSLLHLLHGPDGTDALLRRVAWESAKADPLGALGVAKRSLFFDSLMGKRQLMWNVYQSAPTHNFPAQMFARGNGPASGLLYRALELQYDGRTAASLGLNLGDAGGGELAGPVVADLVMARGDNHGTGVLCIATDMVWGPEKGARVQAGAVKEALRRYPYKATIFMQNFASYFFSFVVGYSADGPSVNDIIIRPAVMPFDDVDPPLRAEVRGAYEASKWGRDPGWVGRFWDTFTLVWMPLRPALFFLALMTFAWWIRPGVGGAVWAAMFLGVMYHAALTAVFALPNFRFINPGLLLLIPLAVGGVGLALRGAGEARGRALRGPGDA